MTQPHDPVRPERPVPAARSQATPSRVPGGQSGRRLWLDRGGLDPEWGSPSRFERWPGWVKRLIPVVALVVVIGTVAVLHGFRQGYTVLQRTAVSSPMQVGPMRIIVQSATATDGGSGAWQVTVHMTCENTSDKSIGFPGLLLDRIFFLVDGTHLGTDRYGSGAVGTYDAGDAASADDLPPGLGPMPCSYAGKFPMAQFSARDHILVGVHNIRWGTDDPTGVKPDEWIIDVNHGWRLQVPVTIGSSPTPEP